MTFVTPCQRPENDPDDWFIGRDGKQYADDDLVTEAQADEIRSAIEDMDLDDPVAAIDLAIGQAEAEAVKAALVRRRHAREKCHSECILRLHCLDAGLEPATLGHGIWGGYFPDERRQIARLRDDRARRRSVHGQE